MLALLIATLLPLEVNGTEKKQTFSKREQVIIFLILQNTNEVAIHQMGGKTGNTVYLSADGHRESVYDKKGDLVKDGINDGSYNYNHPVKEPLLHFTKDIHPWIKWGNSRSDTTTPKKRIYAYMGDLEGGIKRSHKKRETLIKLEKTLSFSKEQKEVLNHWEKILKKEKAKTLFSYFDLSRPMNDGEIISVLTAINKGFKTAY